MTGDEMARQQHDADLLEDLAEDLELDAEAGDGVRGGAIADPGLSKGTDTSVLSKASQPTSSAPVTSKAAPNPADLLKSSLMDKV